MTGSTSSTQTAPTTGYSRSVFLKISFHLYLYFYIIPLITIFMMVIFLLQIAYSQESDGGLYECQVSTASGLISARVLLTVIYPEAKIQGGNEYHVDAGSPVVLTCVIGRKWKMAKVISKEFRSILKIYSILSFSPDGIIYIFYSI